VYTAIPQKKVSSCSRSLCCNTESEAVTEAGKSEVRQFPWVTVDVLRLQLAWWAIFAHECNRIYGSKKVEKPRGKCDQSEGTMP
jgi:hypothetical protein